MSDNTKALDTLIDRVRGLTGPDREVDREIGLTICGWTTAVDQWGEALMVDGNRYPDHPGSEYPTFTDGLDAVVSLVERELPGFSWQVGTNGPDATPFGWVGRGYEASHLAATPTLALLLAFLAAMEEKGE